MPRPGCAALERLRGSFYAWPADVAPREVVRDGLGRGDAAPSWRRNHSWTA